MYAKDGICIKKSNLIGGALARIRHLHENVKVAHVDSPVAQFQQSDKVGELVLESVENELEAVQITEVCLHELVATRPQPSRGTQLLQIGG